MNLLWGVVIVAVAVAAMLLVRRRAPDGSYFNDGDRASGVFGVLAARYWVSLLLGLIVVLVFTSYDDSKTGAESEALAVVQQFETAQFLPPAARGEAQRGTDLLRTVGCGPGVAAAGDRRRERGGQPLGPRPVQDHEGRPAGDRDR